jgi:hypothetical protein
MDYLLTYKSRFLSAPPALEFLIAKNTVVRMATFFLPHKRKTRNEIEVLFIDAAIQNDTIVSNEVPSVDRIQ